MATALDLITRAYRDLGVIGIGSGDLDSALADQGLDALNDLINQWAAEGLMIPYVARTTKAITPSDGTYTVGTGGDFNITRPLSIQGVGLVDTSTDPETEIPLGLMTDEAWRLLLQKELESTRPTAAYFDPTIAGDLATLKVWPIPTGSDLELALYAPAALEEIAALTTDLEIPRPYFRMMRKNLALELAPANGREVSRLLVKQAGDSLAAVKRSNERPIQVRYPAEALFGTGGGWFDIRTGRSGA